MTELNTVASSPAADFDRYHELEEQMFESMLGGEQSQLFLSAERALRYFRAHKRTKQSGPDQKRGGDNRGNSNGSKD